MANNDNKAKGDNFTLKSRLSVVSWNMRGMRTEKAQKCIELQKYLDSCNPTINVLCLQQTKLN